MVRKRWYVRTDDEFNSMIWWGEINLRARQGDPFAQALIDGARGSKKEIMRLVAYGKSIDCYSDGDERAPEALLYGREN